METRSKYSLLAESIQERLNNERCRSAQLLSACYIDENGRHLGYKIINISSQVMKDRIKSIMDSYCESVMFVQESKSSLIYII